jgi:hypothetical protein
MMEVSWDPPASPSAGSIAGYRIYYGMLALPTDMDQWHTVDIEPYTYVEIKGLESHTAYAVRVRARSSDNRLSNFSEIAYTNGLEYGYLFINDIFWFLNLFFVFILLADKANDSRNVNRFGSIAWHFYCSC